MAEASSASPRPAQAEDEPIPAPSLADRLFTRFLVLAVRVLRRVHG